MYAILRKSKCSKNLHVCKKIWKFFVKQFFLQQTFKIILKFSLLRLCCYDFSELFTAWTLFMTLVSYLLHGPCLWLEILKPATLAAKKKKKKCMVFFISSIVSFFMFNKHACSFLYV